MFRRKKKVKSVRASGTIDTLISHGTEIEGTIHSPANLRIDGVFKGEIITQGVIVIGEKGEAHSNMTAEQIIVAGKAVGDLKSRGRLTITSSGVVCGNCECEYLIVDEGGILNGSSIIERKEDLVPIQSPKPGKTKRNDKAEERKGKREEKANEKQAG
ncbi:bactofilin family protein [Paenibacillus marinisediminis]